MRIFLGSLALAAFLFPQQVVFAQSTAPASGTPSNYDAHEAFAPLFYPAYGNDIRTAAGAPGPKYWQNSADYKISARLDDENKSITGNVVITYKNNSPQDLPFLWLQLDQNIYSLKSRGVA